MKKTLIALTLAALPVAASADVILYGQIKGGVEVNRNFTKAYDSDGNKSKQGISTKIVDYGSRIGFKGHEDLNNNLRAIWQLEQKVSIGGPSGDKVFGTRDSFIGLTGGFGTVKAGYLQTPVQQINGRLDQWEYSDSAAGLSTYTRSNAAVKRAGAISYETPNFGGFSAQAYVSPSDNNNRNSTSFTKIDTSTGTPVVKVNTNKDPEAAIYGAKLGYENAGFFADVAGTYVKNSDYAPEGKDGFQAAANVGYEAGNWLAGVGYQQGRYVDDLGTFTGEETLEGGSIVKRSQEVAASTAYTVNNALRLKGSAAYGFGIKGIDSTGDEFKAKYTQGVIGADYLLSKRTTLNGQVGYLQWKLDDDSKLKKGTVGVGMVHKF